MGEIGPDLVEWMVADDLVGLAHKVLTYEEYRAVSGVFQNIDPPPLLHPASVSSPRTKGGSQGGEGVGGSIFWKTLVIGLASNSIISLRFSHMELDIQSLFGLHVHSCTHWLRPRNSLPPLRIWTHIRGRYWSAKIDVSL
jgi:hypothetical protein